MFIGHYGAGLAAKKFAVQPKDGGRTPSLGTLFLASQFLDILWPLFILAGIEKTEIVNSGNPFLNLHFLYYPFSHSLMGAIVWSILFGGIYFLIRKNLRNAVLLGLVVLSHWILDFISHIPDLQLMFGSSLKVGLGLWNSEVFTIIVEAAIFIAGAYLYIKSTKSEGKKGIIILWSLLAFLSIIYVMNFFSPPPPSVDSVAYAGLSQWLIIAWAYWADRNRNFKTSPVFEPA